VLEQTLDSSPIETIPMRTWSCPKKQAARTETILANGPVANQYWSMAGISTTPGCEVDQILKAGFIRPEQFHGVEINRDIYDANLAAYPTLAWHCGDFFQVMRQHEGFSPSLVNADLLQTVDTAADYIARILGLLVPFDAVLIANFVMEHRGYRSTPDYVLKRLAQCQQFRHAMNNGWSHQDRCYLYPGTGNRSRTIMGSFVFKRLALTQLSAGMKEARR
jgi:hypothetical protein